MNILEKLENNAEFMEAMETVVNMEQLQQLLQAHGVELSPEELRNLMAEEMQGELSEEDLDNVAGGGLFSWLKKKFFKSVKKESKKYTKLLNDLNS